MSEPARTEPAIVEFDHEGNATLHLPAAGRRRFLVLIAQTWPVWDPTTRSATASPALSAP